MPVPDDGYFEEGLEVFLNTPPVIEHVRAHEHNFLEIGYMLEGSILHRIDGEEMVINKGEYYIINYHVVHEMDKYSKETPLLQNVLFKPGFIDHYLYQCTDFCELTEHYLINSSFVPDRKAITRFKFVDRDGEIRSIIAKLKDEYLTRKSGFMGMIRSYLIQIIIKSMRYFDEENFKLPEKETDDRQINAVLLYLKNNFQKNIPLEKMASIAYMSPEYFCRKFKAKMGMTPTRYIQQTRIQEACRLLLNTNQKISEIADEVGYGSLKYFKKLFRECCSTSPSEYRQRYRKSLQQSSGAE